MKNWRELADRKKQELDHARKSLERERENKVRLERQLKHEQKAQSILQTVAQGLQHQAHARVADIVSRCLSAVYEGKYEFKIAFDKKRGKTEARFVYLMDGVEVDPTEDGEGGALDVTAIALRLAALLLAQPQPRKLLVLDEPFRFVSRTLAPKVRELLLSLARELDVQFLLVSHDPTLIAGKVVDLS